MSRRLAELDFAYAFTMWSVEEGGRSRGHAMKDVCGRNAVRRAKKLWFADETMERRQLILIAKMGADGFKWMMRRKNRRGMALKDSVRCRRRQSWADLELSDAVHSCADVIF